MYAPEYFYIHHPYCLSKENEKETAMENEEKQQDEKQVRESGQLILDKNDESHRIYLLSIIGEIEVRLTYCSLNGVARVPCAAVSLSVSNAGKYARGFVYPAGSRSYSRPCTAARAARWPI